MSNAIAVKPQLIQWARERINLETDSLAKALRIQNVATVEKWERTGILTLNQLEKISQKTHTPIGYFFLASPPRDQLPISDFRTTSGHPEKPSPDLLSTIFSCQQKQDWLKDILVSDGNTPLSFVGSASMSTSPKNLARIINRFIGLDKIDRTKIYSWQETLRRLTDKVEEAGIMVLRNGVVGNNTHRKLKVSEFRGFCLSDTYAPLIFINARDAKSAQMFTLAHELAHIWLGHSGVSRVSVTTDHRVEIFCNNVASELLLPSEIFEKTWQPNNKVSAEVERLVQMFKVSNLVILIKAYQKGFINQKTFEKEYKAAQGKSNNKSSNKSGGDFYRTQGSRLSKFFIRKVIISTLEGRTTYKEAFQLLGVRTSKTFKKMAETFL